ncbi:MAG: F0F1 ATP synthase subunit epsilon [Xanthomonadales bacterium]|jgi:F-type H+-transporting ATPase subunit epsilon|nr:F0F1 ATP synthase subunit epsilon [Xanthomonadales bacterium]
MKCDIVSARRTVYSGKVSMVVAPGAAGELGIAPRHAPLLTTLTAGAIRVLDDQGEEYTFLIGGGIIEVMPHLVTVLVDTAQRAADFDEQAVRRAKADAERALRERGESRDIAEVQAQLRDAIEQLQALERWRKRVQHKG